MSGRKTSRRSKNIIKLIESGLTLTQIVDKGYSKDTVRYYLWKIKRPEKYAKMLSKIRVLNKKRYNRVIHR